MIGHDTIVAFLAGVNPWWRGEAPRAPSFKRAAYEDCRALLVERRRPRGLFVLGPRKVGKTTLLLQLVAAMVAAGTDPRTLVYLPLGDPFLDLVPLEDVLGAYERAGLSAYAEATFLLDDVGTIAASGADVARLYDTIKGRRYVFTSSVKPADPAAFAESAEGRWHTVWMSTPSFYELLALRGELPPGAIDIPSDLTHLDLFRLDDAARATICAAVAPTVPVFERYLHGGGYPATAREDHLPTVQASLREDVVLRVLEGDVVRLLGVRSGSELRKLLVYLCLHAGDVLSIQACAAAIETTAVTVTSHLEALARAHLIDLAPSRAPDGREAPKPRYKVFVQDGAIASAVLARAVASAPRRALVAATVLRHLASFDDARMPRPAFWRNRTSGEELDFVLRTTERSMPVTVDLGDPAPLAQSAAVIEYCRHDKVTHGYRIVRPEVAMSHTPAVGWGARMLSVPAHVLTFMIGRAEATRRRIG